MRRPRSALRIGTALVILAGCGVGPSPSPGDSPTVEPSASPSRAPTGAPNETPAPTAQPTPTPEPELSLRLPAERDDRVVSVSVKPQLGADDGEILVTVTSQADSMVEELVLRWPTRLSATLFLRPFEPSEERIAEGGPPLVQEWTKWVIGPGEEGEPAGTISLGWGPLMAGATLRIPVDVVRRAGGPVAFDLQVLAENAILTLPNGRPAELRVEVP